MYLIKESKLRKMIRTEYMKMMIESMSSDEKEKFKSQKKATIDKKG